MAKDNQFEVQIVPEIDYRALAREAKNLQKALMSGRVRRQQTFDPFPQNFGKRVMAHTGRIDNFGDAVASAGERFVAWRLGAQAIFAVENAIRSVLSTIVTFEDQVVEVTKVMTIQRNEAVGLGDDLVKLAQEYSTSVTEGANAAKVFAQQGKNVAETIRYTNASLLLMRTSTLSGTESTELITGATKQFKIATEQLIPTLDGLNNVANKHAVLERDVALAMQRSGSAAVAAGLDFSEFTATVTALQAATRQGGQVIGTFLKTFLQRIRRPEAIEMLEQLGIATKDLQGNFRNAFSIMTDLSVVWENLSDVQQRNLTMTLGGLRQSARFIQLMRNFNEALQAQSDFIRGAGSARDELAKKTDTVTASVQRLFAAWTEVGVEIGKAGVADSLKDTVDSVALLTRSLAEAVKYLRFAAPLIASFGGRALAPAAASVFGGLHARISGKLSGGGGGRGVGADVPGAPGTPEGQRISTEAKNVADSMSRIAAKIDSTGTAVEKTKAMFEKASASIGKKNIVLAKQLELYGLKIGSGAAAYTSRIARLVDAYNTEIAGIRQSGDLQFIKNKKLAEATDRFSVVMEKAIVAAEDQTARNSVAMNRLITANSLAANKQRKFTKMFLKDLGIGPAAIAPFRTQTGGFRNPATGKFISEAKALEMAAKKMGINLKAASGSAGNFAKNIRSVDVAMRQAGRGREIAGKIGGWALGIGTAVSLLGNIFAKNSLEMPANARTFADSAAVYATSIGESAAMFAGVGYLFGPWGAAIGALSGSIIGFVKTLIKSQEEVDKAEAEERKKAKQVAKIVTTREQLTLPLIKAIKDLSLQTRDDIATALNDFVSTIEEGARAPSRITKLKKVAEQLTGELIAAQTYDLSEEFRQNVKRRLATVNKMISDLEKLPEFDPTRAARFKKNVAAIIGEIDKASNVEELDLAIKRIPDAVKDLAPDLRSAVERMVKEFAESRKKLLAGGNRVAKAVIFFTDEILYSADILSSSFKETQRRLSQDMREFAQIKGLGKAIGISFSTVMDDAIERVRRQRITGPIINISDMITVEDTQFIDRMQKFTDSVTNGVERLGLILEREAVSKDIFDNLVSGIEGPMTNFQSIFDSLAGDSSDAADVTRRSVVKIITGLETFRRLEDIEIGGAGEQVKTFTEGIEQFVRGKFGEKFVGIVRDTLGKAFEEGGNKMKDAATVASILAKVFKLTAEETKVLVQISEMNTKRAQQLISSLTTTAGRSFAELAKSGKAAAISSTMDIRSIIDSVVQDRSEIEKLIAVRRKDIANLRETQRRRVENGEKVSKEIEQNIEVGEHQIKMLQDLMYATDKTSVAIRVLGGFLNGAAERSGVLNSALKQQAALTKDLLDITGKTGRERVKLIYESFQVQKSGIQSQINFYKSMATQAGVVNLSVQSMFKVMDEQTRAIAVRERQLVTEGDIARRQAIRKEIDMRKNALKSVKQYVGLNQKLLGNMKTTYRDIISSERERISLVRSLVTGGPGEQLTALISYQIGTTIRKQLQEGLITTKQAIARMMVLPKDISSKVFGYVEKVPKFQQFFGGAEAQRVASEIQTLTNAMSVGTRGLISEVSGQFDEFTRIVPKFATSIEKFMEASQKLLAAATKQEEQKQKDEEKSSEAKVKVVRLDATHKFEGLGVPDNWYNVLQEVKAGTEQLIKSIGTQSGRNIGAPVTPAEQYKYNGIA